MKEKHAAIKEKFNDIASEELRWEWAEMISRWEQDKTEPNPYTYTEQGIFVVLPPLLLRVNPHIASSMAEARRRLAEADQQDTQQGSTPHAVPAWVFVRDGLDIEEQQ